MPDVPKIDANAAMMRDVMKLIGADLICAMIAGSATLWAISAGDPFVLTITSALFGSSVTMAYANWGFLRRVAEIERRLARIERDRYR